MIVRLTSGDKHQEIVFSVLSPEPEKNKNVNFLKYPIYVVANQKRDTVKFVEIKLTISPKGINKPIDFINLDQNLLRHYKLKTN